MEKQKQQVLEARIRYLIADLTESRYERNMDDLLGLILRELNRD